MRLSDIYSQDEIDDVDGEIFQNVCEEDLEADFTPFEIPADQVGELLATPMDRLVETWEFAEDWQEDLVEEKRLNFDADRPILVRGSLVVDGHHHAMAAILDGRPVRAIDLDEFCPTPTP